MNSSPPQALRSRRFLAALCRPCGSGRGVLGALLCAASALTAPALAQAQEPTPPAAYRNPVIAGDFADPSVIRVGDVYYATGTSSEWAPYYPLYTSKDLVHWEQIGHVFDQKPEWAASSFWAPELFHHQGTFYVYYTARRKSDNVSVIGVATSDDPRKGFTDRGILREWGSEAIDGFVFRDQDGKLYFSWKAYGLERDRPVTLMACEMKEDALGFKGEPFELLQADGRPISAEGQVMTRRGDWYYLFYSTKGCCGRDCDYQLEVARARNLKGPWEAFSGNPILSGGGAWNCPGHGTLVSLPDGRDWFLYHAYSAHEKVYTGRQGLLDEVLWSNDGWPFFPQRTPSTSATAPLAPAAAGPGSGPAPGPQDFVDGFDRPERAPAWQWDLHHPPKLSIADGRLRLEVAEGAADHPAAAFLGIRVQKGDYTLSATLEPGGSGHEGLAAYGDDQSVLGVRIEDGRWIVWKAEKGQARTLASGPLSEGHSQLRMAVREGHRFRFFSSADGKQWQPLGEETAEFDGAFLPPWDRAPRVGLAVGGKTGDSGQFDAIELRYERP